MDLKKKRHIRILVKAFPQHSDKYEETVCCAGITEDTQELLRLYPIRYRRLDKTNKFERYDLVEMVTTKANDPRPEAFMSMKVLYIALRNEARYRMNQRSVCGWIS